MHFSLALHPLGPGNSLYWLEQQRTRPSTRLRETQVTPLLPGIYGISFHWLLGKFWLQNRVHLEEAEWETSYSVMLQLSDLDFKSLQSRAHLQLVALLVLIILLSPSGVFLCPKRRVLFRTNNLTWQRAAEPTAPPGLSAQDRALRSCWRRPTWISLEGLTFRPSRTTCSSMWATQESNTGLEWLTPVFLLVRAMCRGKDMAQLGCGTCTSPSALITLHCRETGL